MRYGMILIWAVGMATVPGYDPDEVIQRVKLNAMRTVKSVPNYTCVETVSREFYQPTAVELPRTCEVALEQRHHRTLDMGLRFFSRDRLRLDVTMTGHGEVFSWVGAKKFEDGGIDQVVRSGPMSTGSFAGFLTAVFETDVKKLTFDQSKMAGQRLLLQYSFYVPRARSHYRVRSGREWVMVDYGGTIDVDPETADVVAMRIESGAMPDASGICQATTAMEFVKVSMSGGQFLLPKKANNHFIYPNGDETENTMTFGNCREFHGESTLTFGPYEGAADGNSKAAAWPEMLIPAGMSFSMALTKAIATDTTAAGDAFSAKLAEAVRDVRGKVIYAKGTPVEGRVLRVQSYARPPSVVVVLRPEAFRIRGERVPFNAIRDWSRARLRSTGKGRKKMEIVLTAKGESYAQAYQFEGEHAVVPSGFQSDWKTSEGNSQ